MFLNRHIWSSQLYYLWISFSIGSIHWVKVKDFCVFPLSGCALYAFCKRFLDYIRISCFVISYAISWSQSIWTILPYHHYWNILYNSCCIKIGTVTIWINSNKIDAICLLLPKTCYGTWLCLSSTIKLLAKFSSNTYNQYEDIWEKMWLVQYVRINCTWCWSPPKK